MQKLKLCQKAILARDREREKERWTLLHSFVLKHEAINLKDKFVSRLCKAQKRTGVIVSGGGVKLNLKKGREECF